MAFFVIYKDKKHSIILGDNIKNFINNNLVLIQMILSFILFWIFKNIATMIVVIGVVLYFLIVRIVYKVLFNYFEVIIFIVYMVSAIYTIFNNSKESMQIFIIIIGFWLVYSFSKDNRANNK